MRQRARSGHLYQHGECHARLFELGAEGHYDAVGARHSVSRISPYGEVSLSDGGSVDFYDLERDVETLARALRYLVEERGVALDDPDGLLAHMTGGALAAESLYAYLDSLDRDKQKDREGR